jgi:SAM-dependent methyltransferase
MAENSNIINDVNDYYSGKIKEHGATARGVDWNSEESQHNRFAQLAKLIALSENNSVLDYGCGYGAIFPYLRSLGCKGEFTGFDISVPMIEEARRQNASQAEFITALPENKSYDYVLASGIFNVRMKYSNSEWEKYIADTLDTFHRISRKGFAFNMLTAYSDAEFMRDNLFYADPAVYFHHCKTNYSKQVALLHDYGLYEFTLIVRK